MPGPGGECPPAGPGDLPATGPHGLTAHDAALRLAQDGPNTLPALRAPSPLRLLLAQLTHFFALLLWAAAAGALVAGMPALAAAIVVVIVLNGGFAFAQEWRADRAAARIAQLLPTRVTVRRDGRRVEVDAAALVVGDRVLLAAGDRVCADLRLDRIASVALDESMLTGESVPSRPGPGGAALAGTFVVDGAAEGVVSATGGGTRLAGLSALTRQSPRPPSPLARRLRHVVRVITVIAVSVGVACLALSVALGADLAAGLVLAIGVCVALVPEGLLPTVTLSLAHGAQRMARSNALVRHLESVETLGSTTFICTDKTGTLTTNEMSVVRVWTPSGEVEVAGAGFAPTAAITGSDAARAAARQLAVSAVLSSVGRVVRRGERWTPTGDPMEVALHVLALRLSAGAPLQPVDAAHRAPFDPRRRRVSVRVGDALHVKGAADAVLPLCADDPEGRAVAADAAERLSAEGLRVLAVARRALPEADPRSVEETEHDLTLLGLVGLEDPPRDDVAAALAQCRRAGIKVAMVTGDHPATARAVAAQTGLAPADDGLVVTGAELPADLDALGALLDSDGVVVARVTPEDKLRIATALQRRGHVVAMTGDGVNDGPALQAADIGVAMGRSGTDVAREAADLVLLDDHFATIVTAVEQGRATYANIRRFLTYHLTDNVSELAPFLLWGLTAGRLPLAIGVLQVLALDIGTDLLPALALGAEPPGPRVLAGPPTSRGLVDRAVLTRVFGVLGPAEAIVEMGAFALVLLAGGWAWAQVPEPGLLAVASGTAFAAVVLGQLANAFACRSETRWAGAVGWSGNPLLLGAVGVEALLLVLMVGLPALQRLLGGAWPSALGWLLAALAVPAVILADAAEKAVRGRRSRPGRTPLPPRRDR